MLVRGYRIQGRVQGVGFRWFVQREAAEIGLNGWVKNLPSGEVEAVAAGSADQITRLEAKLRAGSRGSRVDKILIEELPSEQASELGPFVIEGAW